MTIVDCPLCESGDDDLIPQECTRVPAGHDGPCNGYPRPACRGYADWKANQRAAQNSAQSPTYAKICVDQPDSHARAIPVTLHVDNPAEAEAGAPRSDDDGTAKLCHELYGRKAQPRDYLGGSNARMLYHAVDKINALRAELETTRAELAAATIESGLLREQLREKNIPVKYYEEPA